MEELGYIEVIIDGKTADEFHSILLENIKEVENIELNIIKDDCKLIAQLFNRKIEGYITKDRKSFNQIIKPISETKDFTVDIVDFSIPFKEFRGELF